ncbi:MAG: hypothetical protein AVDCRST_MAG87-2376, partial [uncultured Thermomicrobiales bacterium]
ESGRQRLHSGARPAVAGRALHRHPPAHPRRRSGCHRAPAVQEAALPEEWRIPRRARPGKRLGDPDDLQRHRSRRAGRDVRAEWPARTPERQDPRGAGGRYRPPRQACRAGRRHAL